MPQVLEDDGSHVVYISNLSSGHDYSPAAWWGAMKPVTSGNYPIFKVDRLREEISDVLLQSSADDYLLLSGSSMVAGMCMAFWLALHDHVNLLLFDKGMKAYVVRTITRSELYLDIELARGRASGRGAA